MNSCTLTRTEGSIPDLHPFRSRLETTLKRIQVIQEVSSSKLTGRQRTAAPCSTADHMDKSSVSQSWTCELRFTLSRKMHRLSAMRPLHRLRRAASVASLEVTERLRVFLKCWTCFKSGGGTQPSGHTPSSHCQSTMVLQFTLWDVLRWLKSQLLSSLRRTSSGHLYQQVGRSKLVSFEHPHPLWVEILHNTECCHGTCRPPHPRDPSRAG